MDRLSKLVPLQDLFLLGTTDKSDDVTSVSSDEPKEKIDENLSKNIFAVELNMVRISV